eukprot:CAMPEP_0196251102 /NCGR_PEP_ID=MMETSP0913-20130531/46713_1 /TAXON_ID=49265 /ORGANISM="Thalassiosira rotula, Strain GSO102" /LENGTH=33 /DNA_ID= /DNA_START= /DNA_END= /DNA_ORIENTATION=
MDRQNKWNGLECRSKRGLEAHAIHDFDFRPDLD